MLTEVKVFGPLGESLSAQTWKFDLERPVDVFRALNANTDDGILRFFTANPASAYTLIMDDVYAQEHDLLLVGRRIKCLKVVPVIAGSGNEGSWLALIGIAIVALVLLVPSGGTSGWAALTTSGVSLGSGASFALTLGLALTLTGIAQMVYGSNGPDTVEKGDRKPSYLFNGPVNTVAQGNPIPLGFGRMIVGSQIISVGVRSVDIAVDSTSE